jgi:MFS family permease
MAGAREAGVVQGSVLVAQSILPVMGSILLVPVLPLLFREYGAMPGANYLIPMLLTVPGLCIALLSPLFGWLADRVGRRRVLISALIFYGFAGIAPIFLTSFQAVLASRVILGITDAAVIVVSTVMIGDYFDGERRARWLALISTLATLAATAFLALGGGLGEAFGWRGPVAVYALALAFVPAMLLFTWEPETPTAAEPARVRHSTDGLSRHLWIMGATTLFGAVLFYTLALQLGLGLAALGTADPGRLGTLASFASIGNLIATLVFRRLTHIATLVMLSVAFGLIATGLIAIGWVETDIQFAVAAFVGMFGAGLLMPALITATMQPLPFAIRGRGSSVFHASFALGQFGSGIAVAGLADLLAGDVLTVFATLGALALVAALAAVALRLMPRGSPDRAAFTGGVSN